MSRGGDPTSWFFWNFVLLLLVLLVICMGALGYCSTTPTN